MKIQKEISRNINKNFVGKTIPCIIEQIHENGKIVARSYKDAPEIDGLVYIKTKEYVTCGEILNVKIKNSTCYDLYGTI